PCLRCSFSDIIGVQNDIRVIATELEHGLLQILSGMGRDDFTGALRTRQGYALYAFIGDNLFDLIMCCKKVGVDPFRSARIIKKFLDSECRSGTRSEEHTSELQSRFDLVCRLLLEKKKQQ